MVIEGGDLLGGTGEPDRECAGLRPLTELEGDLLTNLARKFGAMTRISRARIEE